MILNVSRSFMTSSSGLPHTDAAAAMAVVLPTPDSLLCICNAAQFMGDIFINTEPKEEPTTNWCSSNPSRL